MSQKTDERSVTSLIAAPPEDLCLSFVNTKFWRGSAEPTETLLSLDDLRGWIAGNTELDAAGHLALANLAEDAGLAALDQAIGLREQLYRVFAAIAAKAPIPEADLAGFNATLSRVPARTHLAAGGSGAVWAVRNLDAAIPDLLTPVIWAAADLLAQKEHHRLRSCANDKCLWLFIDRSKAGTRRWCDMKGGGTGQKPNRHYARSKLR